MERRRGRRGSSPRRERDYDERRSRDRKRRRSSERPGSCDDENHHYVIQLGESLTPRYKVLSVMGEGTFGKVAECWDRERRKYVAVKIIRSLGKYRDAAMIEIDVLETLLRSDPHARRPCVQLLSWFDFRNHVCMVFEKYGLSLYDFLKKNHYKPFRLPLVQQFAYQLLDAVAFMHENSLIHTDLKPENILLEQAAYHTELVPPRPNTSQVPTKYRVPVSPRIKLIDFGSATFETAHHTAIVSTRHYRAPEVVLGLGWTYPCDIWSVGTLLVELFTGDAMFQTHENHEHLALMERTFGPLPESMVRRCERSARKYFDDRYRLVWPTPETRTASREHVALQRTLRETVAPENDADESFVDLLAKLLVYEPERRLSAAEALRHPFVQAGRELLEQHQAGLSVAADVTRTSNGVDHTARAVPAVQRTA